MVEAPVSPHTEPATSIACLTSSNADLYEEVRRDVEKAMKEGKLPEVVSVARKVLQTASRSPVSIAVTGDSGNGMSSFINALRCIGHEEEGSAPTGVVRTTQTPTRYYAPNFPHVELWDLPGMGATGQSVERYVQDMGFSRCDLVVLVASEQFSCNHVGLAAAMQALGKRFYVVWTKLDRDLSTSAHSETELWQNIREHIRLSLQKERVQEPPIFLVSSLEPSSHDFQRLREMLSKDLCSIRCHSPLESLSQICNKSIDDKAASMQGSMSTEYLQVTLGISNAEDLEQSLGTYRRLFGVDDESLQCVAQSTRTPVASYRDAMKCRDLRALCRGDWRLRAMTCFVANMLLSFLGYFSALSGCLIRGFRHMRHRHILGAVAQDSKTTLRKILESAVPPCGCGPEGVAWR